MTIFNAAWRQTADRAVIPRLYVAHPDLARIAGILRDTTQSVWTELPSDQSKHTASKNYSLEGWRVHFKAEYAQLNQFNTAHGTKVEGYDAQAKTALDGYLASLPVIAQAFNTVTAKYVDGSGNLIQTTITQADRDSIAAVIEGELQ